ncbi:MAG: ferrous iron transport protein A [Planctomycetes bacterium]|nr:ferrous iron transport protein A [Planctomycetota bacterium]
MLSRGEQARICGVQGDDAVAVRLMEMGLVEGQTIEHLGAAPLGDPVEYSVCGYRLSLRLSEARRVQVE